MTLFELDTQLLQWINHNRLRPLDDLMIFITDTAYLAAVLVALGVYFYGRYKKDWLLSFRGKQLIVAFLLNSVLITILKYSINRERPFTNNPLIEKLSSGGSPSFPSGHTADAILIATSIFLLFPRQRWILILVATWALVVAYSRMALGVHYPADVLCSVFIGISIAFITHSFFKRRLVLDRVQTPEVAEALKADRY
jgi:undecaprenyl-diphosphatase